MPTIRRRLAIAVVVGAVVGALLPIGDIGAVAGSAGTAGAGPARGFLVHALAGFVVGGLTFALPLLLHVLGHDAPATREKVQGRDGDAAWYDVVVILVGLAGLTGVGILLVGGRERGTQAVVDALVGAGAVAVGWLCVHTVYVLRYARVYYASPRPPIDFNQDADPAFSDFAYFSFNLGMTYQVSDTGLSGSGIRRVVLGHCLLAYLFGTVVIASTINLVVGLGGALG